MRIGPNHLLAGIKKAAAGIYVTLTFLLTPLLISERGNVLSAINGYATVIIAVVVSALATALFYERKPFFGSAWTTRESTIAFLWGVAAIWASLIAGSDVISNHANVRPALLKVTVIDYYKIKKINICMEKGFFLLHDGETRSLCISHIKHATLTKGNTVALEGRSGLLGFAVDQISDP